MERIAVGGMAEVYLAKSFGVEGFEKVLAIKRILPTMAEDSEFIEMFIDEAKIAGSLSHSNIVPIYELGRIGDSHYIAMEFVWGKDMLQIMNRFRRLRKRMPPVMVAWLVSKICEALDYAHNKRDAAGNPLNLIHRDISPQNILVSYEGQVKLIDFGIAKAASRTTRTQAGVLKGKFGYMSPEQVRGHNVDHRSDVFAVGTCMYEMLSSERLFLGGSDFSTLEKVRKAEVLPPSQKVPNCPPELDQIVLKALAREPDDRYATANELNTALQRFVASQRPPFGTSKLAAWMKTAFNTERAGEKRRMDSYASVSKPGAALMPVPPPAAASAGGDSDFPEEATLVTDSPFDAQNEPPTGQVNAPPAKPQGELEEVPTQIFFSVEEFEEEMGISEHPAAAQHKMPPPGGRQLGAPPPRLQSPVVPARAAAVPAMASPQPMPKPLVLNADPQEMTIAKAAPVAPMGRSPLQPPVAVQANRTSQNPLLSDPANAPPPSFGQPLVNPGNNAPGLVGAAGDIPATSQRRIPTAPMQPERIVDIQAPAVAAQAEPPVAKPKKKKARTGLFIALAAAALLLLSGVGFLLFMLLRGGDVGSLQVASSPAVGAQVFLDGQLKGTTPLSITSLPAGPHRLELKATGFQDATREFTLQEGSAMHLEISMQVQPTVAAATGGLSAVPVAAPPPPPQHQPPRTEQLQLQTQLCLRLILLQCPLQNLSRSHPLQHRPPHLSQPRRWPHLRPP